MKKSSERICFILNPSAGRSNAQKKCQWLKSRVEKYWENHEIRISGGAAELSAIAKDASQTFDTIVACGGDGTINQIVNSIPRHSCKIGILPFGSGNDFAKAINLPSDPEACLDILKTGKTQYIDAIQLKGDTDLLCINTLGIGLDGFANYYASTAKNLRGRMVYIYGILKAVFNFRGSMMRLITSSTESVKEILMVTLCNGPEEGGGFKVAPDADNTDGCMNLLIIDKLPVMRVLWYLPKFLLQPRKKLKGVDRLSCKKLTVESEQSVAVHCDGEYLGSHIRVVHADIRPGYMHVIVP